MARRSRFDCFEFVIEIIFKNSDYVIDTFVMIKISNLTS